MIILNQLLKVMNWCESGAEANELIDDGKIKVNGKFERRKRNKLSPGMIVEYGSRKVELV